MAKQRHNEWVTHNCLRGVAVGALVFTLFDAAWAGAPAGTLTTTPVATALPTVSAGGLVAVGRGWGWGW
jgi:hypothetical protein